MRIGIDYLPAVCHAPGIGRYGRELVRALVRLPAPPELRLFEVGGGERTMGHDLGLEGAAVRRYRRRLPRRVVRGLHRYLGIGADRWLGGVDLFQRMLPNYPPVSKAAEILPVVELPPTGSPADVVLAGALSRAQAALVFCEHYAREVPARYGIRADQVHQVPVGCDHWQRVDVGQSSPWSPLGDPAARSIVVLGALRAERFPLEILRAFEQMDSDQATTQLLFVGRPGSAAAAFESALSRSPARQRVNWIQSPVEAQMPSLMAQASLLVHLSQEEGTAVTPLEGFAAGLPVVASALPAFAEALGSHASLLTPAQAADPATLAAAMTAALNPENGLASRSARMEVAAGFSWSRNAAATLEIWTRLHTQLHGA